MRLKNNYFILRHGEAVSNRDKFVSCWPEKIYNPLTKRGKKQIQKIIPKLKKEKINLIFSSDLLRTKQTAEIVAESLGLDINYDKRLREYNAGIFNNKSIAEWKNYFSSEAEKFIKRPPKGENRRDIIRRMADFIKDIDKKYKNKNILIISHEDPLMNLESAIKGFSEKESIKNWEKFRIKLGELKKIYIV